MADINSFKGHDDIAWCPGCGNFGILNAVNKALVKLGKPPHEVLLVSGIGQAAKLPHYMACNCFNGLHGRSLPAAAGAKIANRGLTVLVTTGDGDTYGEGGNHFLHAIRRNLDITLVVHDNQIYGLTKGQASPTTEEGYTTKVQYMGVLSQPLHPLELAIALGCGFVARGYSKEIELLSELIIQGIQHRGFSLIDVLQPCISYNRKNTYEWYSERVYKLDGTYDPTDKLTAYQKVWEWDEKIPIGVIYKNEARACYEEKSGIDAIAPLVDQEIENIDLTAVFDDFR